MDDPILVALGITLNNIKLDSYSNMTGATIRTTNVSDGPFVEPHDSYGNIVPQADTIYKFAEISYGTKDPEQIQNFTQFRLPLLIKRSVNGVDKCWMVGWDGQSMIVNHGDHKGEVIVKKRPVTINNHSKSLIHQVLQEMNQRYKKKWQQARYTPFEQQSDLAFTKDCEPMLAKVYRQPKRKNGVQMTYARSGELVYHNLLKHGDVLIQPKADGTRADVTLGPTGDVIIRSRLGNEFKWLTELKEELRIFCGYFPPGWRIDGELYHPQANFNQIMTAVKTILFEHEWNKHIMYMIFDINDAIPTKEVVSQVKARYPHDQPPSHELRYPTEHRVKLLDDALKRFEADMGHLPHKFSIIPSYQCPNDTATLEKWMNYFCDGAPIVAPDGKTYTIQFEGIMIRKTLFGGYPRQEVVYKNGRSCNLLKMKRGFDAEGVIIGAFTEETYSRDLMMFEMRMIDDMAEFRKTRKLLTAGRPNALRDGTIKGLGFTFTLRPAADEPTRRQWWLLYCQGNHQNFIGKIYTYKYQELTPDGKPRNPVGYRFYEEY